MRALFSPFHFSRFSISDEKAALREEVEFLFEIDHNGLCFGHKELQESMKPLLANIIPW